MLLRPTTKKIAAEIPQITATMSADHPFPTRYPSAHHMAIDRKRIVMCPAYAPAPSIAPAFADVFADSRTSALASATSCLISVDLSPMPSLASSPSDGLAACRSEGV